MMIGAGKTVNGTFDDEDRDGVSLLLRAFQKKAGLIRARLKVLAT
jgi:hypothetical protein